MKKILKQIICSLLTMTLLGQPIYAQEEVETENIEIEETESENIEIEEEEVDEEIEEETSITGTCGTTLSWILDEGILTITGEGAMTNYKSGTAPWYEYSTSIFSVVIDTGVTSIGNYAFANLKSLEDVTIPDSVTKIGTYAFLGCEGMTEITLPNNVTVLSTGIFKDSGLRNVSIPDGITSIGKNAFYNCYYLEEVNIPEAVTTIGDKAFYSCVSLTQLRIPASVTSIGAGAFRSCDSMQSVIVDPDNLVYDSRDNCNAIIETQTNTLLFGFSLSTIPETIETIGSYAFYYTPIECIEIPESVTSIGTNAFYGCLVLMEINIPSQITTIEEGAFRRCISLERITIPNSVTSIGKMAFYDCMSLSNIKLSNQVTTIGESAFAQCISLPRIIIPESVTSIGASAFASNSEMNSIVFKGNAPEIGENALNTTSSNLIVQYPKDNESWSEEKKVQYETTPITWQEQEMEDKIIIDQGTCGNECSWTLDEDGLLTIFGTGDMEDFNACEQPWQDYVDDVTSVVIEEGVTSIGNYAFSNFYFTKEYEIADSVERIGNYAFEGNKKISQLTLPNSISEIGKGAFHSSSLKSIVLPENLTKICEETFLYCTELTTISIPNRVINIGNRAFEGCSKLQNVDISSTLTNMGEYTFKGCTTLSDEDGFVIVNGTLFDYLGTETDIIIPEEVLEISSEAFYEANITSVTIPETVTTLGKGAFKNCSQLSSLTISDNVVDIYENAFKGCTSLSDEDGYVIVNHILYDYLGTETEITIPEDVEIIGESACIDCSFLISVTIPETVTKIGNYAFNNCSHLSQLSLPDEIEIGQEAFADCYGLKDEQGFIIIKNILFQYTGNKSNLIIPSYVSRIDPKAFYYDSFIESITIPNDVQVIEESAFYGCFGVDSIYYYGTQEEWENTQIEKGNECLSKGEVIFLSKPETARLEGYSLSLSGSIGVDFYMTIVDEATLSKDTFLRFTLPNGTIKEVNIQEAKMKIVEDKKCYIFSCVVSAKDMTSTIQAQLFNNEVELSEVYSYTVEEYAKYLIEHETKFDPKDISIAKAMLTYGKYTQEYFEYNTEYLPTNINPLEENSFENYAYQLEDENENLSFVGARLLLTTTPGIKLYFVGEATFQVNGKEVETTKEGRYTIVTIENIQDMDTMYEISSDHFRLNYGIFSYGNQAAQTDNEKLKNVMQAMYAYNQSLKRNS